jgi:hypothetical protein
MHVQEVSTNYIFPFSRNTELFTWSSRALAALSASASFKREEKKCEEINLGAASPYPLQVLSSYFL